MNSKKATVKPSETSITLTVPNKRKDGWVTVNSPIQVESGLTPQSRLRKTMKKLGGMPTKHSQIQEVLGQLGYRLPTVDELHLFIPEGKIVGNLYWVQTRKDCLFDPYKGKWAKISSKSKNVNILAVPLESRIQTPLPQSTLSILKNAVMGDTKMSPITEIPMPWRDKALLLIKGDTRSLWSRFVQTCRISPESPYSQLEVRTQELSELNEWIERGGGLPLLRDEVVHALGHFGLRLPKVWELQVLYASGELDNCAAYWTCDSRDHLWSLSEGRWIPPHQNQSVGLTAFWRDRLTQTVSLSETQEQSALQADYWLSELASAFMEDLDFGLDFDFNFGLEDVPPEPQAELQAYKELVDSTSNDRFFELFCQSNPSVLLAQRFFVDFVRGRTAVELFDAFKALSQQRDAAFQQMAEIKSQIEQLKSSRKEILSFLDQLKNTAERLSQSWQNASREEKVRLREKQAENKEARQRQHELLDQNKHSIDSLYEELNGVYQGLKSKDFWRHFKYLLKSHIQKIGIRDFVKREIAKTIPPFDLEEYNAVSTKKQYKFFVAHRNLITDALPVVRQKVFQFFEEQTHFRFSRSVVERALGDVFKGSIASFLGFVTEDQDQLFKRLGKIEKRLERSIEFFDNIKGVSKTQWEARYTQLVRHCQAQVEVLLDDSDEILDSHLNSLRDIAISRIKTQVNASHEVYRAVPQLSIKLTEVIPGTLGVTLEDGFDGRMVSGASIIAKILDDKDFTDSFKAWKLDFGGIPESLKPKAWDAIAKVCKAYRLIPIANNGSCCLIKLFKEGTRELSGPAKFLEALFENFSEYGAYGLSILNAQPQDKTIAGPHHEPINGFVDNQGRRTVSILYDSRALDWLPGVDGSGLNSLDYTGQHRCFMLNKSNGKFLGDELRGAFFKGLGANSRVTLLDYDHDFPEFSTPWSVQDILNVRYLSRDVLSNMFSPDLVEEIEGLTPDAFGMFEVSEELQTALDSTGHFVSTARTETRLRKEKIERWDSWFSSRKDLPSLFGLEIGQLKGKGKRTLKSLMTNLQSNTYYYEVVDKKKVYSFSDDGTVPNGATLDDQPKVDSILEAHGGWIPLTSEVYGWSIIDSPDKSSMALNYQPQAPIILSPEELQSLDASYHDKTTEFFNSFKEHKDKGRISKFLNFMLGEEAAAEFAEWPSALMRNPVSSLWRWTTNFDITQNSTKRLLMVDYGVNRFTGLVLIEGNEESNLCRTYDEELGRTREGIRRCASWRAPLIVPSAIQAPYAITGRLAARLLDSWRRKGQEVKEEHSEQHQNDLDQLETIMNRLAFKRKESLDVIKQNIEGILGALIKASCLVKLNKQLVIMDVADVEDMQGDDDGDTVVIHFDEVLAKRFAYTEQWWDKFYRSNGLRPIKVEMTKANQINFGKANSIYDENPTPLSEDQKAFISDFGIVCPEVANHYRLEGSKIPNPLGASFSLLLQIEKQTGNKLLGLDHNFAALAAKLGSSPTGPIGAGSDIAPDLLIRALAQTDENLVLNDYGKRLYQGYATMASTVQVSIDWAKRVYRILNAALYDQTKSDGKWLINFEEEITPEAAQRYLLTNTFRKVYFVRFKVFSKKGKKRQTVAYKTVRFILNEKAQSPALNWQTVSDYDTGGIYPASQSFLESLSSGLEINGPQGQDGITYHVETSVNEVDLLDESNSCFSFSSMYAVGSFMIQPRIRGFRATHDNSFYNSVVNAASWKKPVSDIFSRSPKIAEPISIGISAGAPNSALVAHFTRMLGYVGPRNLSLFSISGRLQKAFEQKHQETPVSAYLDGQFPFVNRAVASFFSEEYTGSDRGDLNKGRVITLALKNFGLESNQIPDLMSGKQVQVKDYSITIADVLSCLFRNDFSFTSEKVPQSLSQMVLQEYFNQTEKNPFSEVVDDIVSETIKQVKEQLSRPFQRNGSNGTTQDVYFNFLKKGSLNSGFFEGDRLSTELVNELIRCRYLNKTSREDGSFKYSWADDKAPFKAIAFILYYHKKEIFNSDNLWEKLTAVWDTELNEFETDDDQDPLSVLNHSHRLKALLHSAIKNAAAEFDSDIRTWLSYSQQEEITPNLIKRNGDYSDHFYKKFKQAFTNKDSDTCLQVMREVRPENFANVSRSNEQLFWSWIGGSRLPQAQVSRSTLAKAIESLARSNVFVKSWSYYASASWKTPTAVQAFAAHNSELAFISPAHGEINMRNGSQPNFDEEFANYALFRTTLLNMEGASSRKVQNTISGYKKKDRQQALADISGHLYTEYQGLFGKYRFRSVDLLAQYVFQYLSKLKQELDLLSTHPKASQAQGFSIIQVVSPGSVWEWEGRRYYKLAQLENDIKSKMAF